MSFHRGTLQLWNISQATLTTGAAVPGPVQTSRTTVSAVPAIIVSIVNQLITTPPISAPALLATDQVLQTTYSLGATTWTYYIFTAEIAPPLVVIADAAGIVGY